jgi:DNA mismatch repair ATPase MutS
MISSKKKQIKYLRSQWGKSVDKFRNIDLIAAYHNLLSPTIEEFVDEKTWNDLEFDSIFAKIDRNLSGVGQQYLYHLLHKYELDERLLKNRNDLIMLLKHDQNLREKIQIDLLDLTGESSYFIPYLILSKSLPKAKFYKIFYLLSALSVISAIMIAVDGVYLFITLGILLTNLILNKIFSRNIHEYFTGFSSLNSLIISAISISKIKHDNLPQEIKLLKKKRGLLISLKKKLGYLVIDKQSLNELAVVIIEYLNMFLLFDIIAYYRSVNVLQKNQDEIKSVFEAIANLDTSISIASYLTEIKYYCIPTIHNSDAIKIDGVYHPLIEDAVPNSLDVLSSSVLITGSNMSGKTTFIKTVGINFILSQTLFFSLSRESYIPRLKIKSSIRRNEEMEQGKSYFFVEIERLNDFIKLSKSENQYLFLIDEIYRGTNTLERLAISTAVLKYLDIQNKVFCTTHDIELQDLLEENYKMFHFSEQVADSNFYFNYKINEGPCSSGNAIKLLEIMNYPPSIITEANLIVERLLIDGNNIIKIKL